MEHIILSTAANTAAPDRYAEKLSERTDIPAVSYTKTRGTSPA